MHQKERKDEGRGQGDAQRSGGAEVFGGSPVGG